jgi:hypothetical protein
LDFQIWVEADKKNPLLRKFVITFKRVNGQPAYVAVFSDWDSAPKLEEGFFNFKAPPDYRKIEFLRKNSAPGPASDPEKEKKEK